MKRTRGKKCFLPRFPLGLRVIIAAWLLFSVAFGLYLAYSTSRLQHLDTVTHRRYEKIKLPETSSLQQYGKRQSKTARRNLIILSHGRSGSSITGDIFNHHPDVFYMYEPLQTVERTRDNFKLDYNSLALKFLSNVLQYDFSEPIFLADIEGYYRKPNHPRISQAIASPPLCPYNMSDARWDFKLCSKITSETLENVCKNHYKLL